MDEENIEQENSVNSVEEQPKEENTGKNAKKIDIGISILLALILSIIASSKATFLILSLPIADQLLKTAISILFFPITVLLLLASVLQSEGLTYSIAFSSGALLLPLWGLIFYLIAKLIRKLKPSSNFVIRHIVQLIFTLLLIIPILLNTPIGSEAVSKNISASGSSSFTDCLSGKITDIGLKTEFNSDLCFKFAFDDYIGIKDIETTDKRLDLCGALSETEKVASPVSVFTINQLTHQEYCIFTVYDLVTKNFSQYSANVREYVNPDEKYELLKERLDEIGLPETLLHYTDFKDKQLSFDEFNQKKKEAVPIYCEFVGNKFNSSEMGTRCLEYAGNKKYITGAVDSEPDIITEEKEDEVDEITGVVITWEHSATIKTDNADLSGSKILLKTDELTSWASTLTGSDTLPSTIQFDYELFTDVRTTVSLNFEGEYVHSFLAVPDAGKEKVTKTVFLPKPKPSLNADTGYSVAFRLDGKYTGEGYVEISNVKFGY